MREPDIGALQRRVSSRQFAGWIAYNEVEPWVPNYLSYHIAGIIAAEIHNSFQMFAKHKKAKQPEDYMPDWEYPAPALASVEDVEAANVGTDADLLLKKASAMFFGLGGLDKTKSN